MNAKRVLPLLVVLAGFSVPAQAQGPLPVHVHCVKGQGTYKPICSDVKQALKRSPLFKPAKNGSRYYVHLFAETGEIDGGLVSMSITYGAHLGDPLSQVFPHMISSFPWVLDPSDSRLLGEVIVSTGLPFAIGLFTDVVDEINSYGTLGRELSEATGDDISEKMKFEMDKILKEQTNK